MSEPGETPTRATAGSLLRAAREKQGLHIAALAAAIKVAPRKLDALENDRYDELPDATFTRALAQTICRTLKVDPHPVLGLLPVPESSILDHVGGTLNTPFKDRSPREESAGLAVAAIRPMVWGGIALLVAALAVYFAPEGLLRWPAARPDAAAPVAAASAAPAVVAAAPEAASEAAFEAASAPLSAASAADGAMPVASAAVAAAAVVASASMAAPMSALAPAPALASVPAVVASAPRGTSLVQVSASGPSWVEVRDARGKVVFSRVVEAGENVGVDGEMPLRLTVGNAPGTRVAFRGQPVDLAPLTRNNVARFELK